jgi:hypothetical protein
LLRIPFQLEPTISPKKLVRFLFFTLPCRTSLTPEIAAGFQKVMIRLDRSNEL